MDLQLMFVSWPGAGAPALKVSYERGIVSSLAGDRGSYVVGRRRAATAAEGPDGPTWGADDDAGGRGPAGVEEPRTGGG